MVMIVCFKTTTLAAFMYIVLYSTRSEAANDSNFVECDRILKIGYYLRKLLS